MIKITKKALYTLVALFLLNSCYMDYVYSIRVINYTDKNYVTYDSYYDSLGAYCDSLNSTLIPQHYNLTLFISS